MKSEDVDEGVTLKATLSIQLQPLRVRDHNYWSVGIGLRNSLCSRRFSCTRTGRNHDIVRLQMIDNGSLFNGRFEFPLARAMRGDGKESGACR